MVGVRKYTGLLGTSKQKPQECGFCFEVPSRIELLYTVLQTVA